MYTSLLRMRCMPICYSKVRPAAAGAAPLYKQEARAKMRNAKIRLTRYNLEELTQVMRGRAKWIKH